MLFYFNSEFSWLKAYIYFLRCINSFWCIFWLFYKRKGSSFWYDTDSADITSSYVWFLVYDDFIEGKNELLLLLRDFAVYSNSVLWNAPDPPFFKGVGCLYLFESFREPRGRLNPWFFTLWGSFGGRSKRPFFSGVDGIEDKGGAPAMIPC